MNCRLVAGLLAAGLLLAACGGGSTVPPPSPNPEPPAPEEGAATYASAGCGACHGDDGAGGFGPSILCYPVDGLDAYLRTEGTPHVGGRAQDLDADALAALSTFLDSGACTGGAPDSHDTLRDGTWHRTGEVSSCAPCHGASGEGFGSTPSCASCHGSGEPLTCTGCHASAKDNGDDLPQGGRREVISEFSASSHHVGADVTDDDCVVCHDMSKHQEGAVRLWNVDRPGEQTAVIALTGDPLAVAAEAVKLDAFCLACHDADAANGSAPFSSLAMPSAVDATVWSSSAHHGASLTCMGDGETFGCHSSGHGSTKRMLLGPADGSDDGVTGDTTREEEGFCYTCHQDAGLASSDIESEFARTHRHKVGSHDQGDDIALECSSCHDPHMATSTTPLRDPDTGKLWTGTMQAFCLACHGGTVPDDISFPSTTTGTGYDKSAFVGTTHATELGDDSCVDCHEVHGSSYQDLLFDDYVVADSNRRTTGDYDACWDCHSASTILTKNDAFSEYHKKHVIDENLTCAECHDVHAPYDSTEPGLISFELAFDQNWSISFPFNATTLSSAFYIDTDTGRGYCAITCHGERHATEDYRRGGGN